MTHWRGEGVHTACQGGAQRLVFLALMTALAMVLQILESILPNPAPWIRLGLANVIILVILDLYGLKAGLLVTLLKVILASTLLGTIFGPTFWLGISGGTASTLAMGSLIALFPGRFSLIGISVVGAYAHNLVQLLVASFVIIRQPGLAYLLPVLMVTSLGAGLVTGMAATLLRRRITGSKIP